MRRVAFVALVLLAHLAAVAAQNFYEVLGVAQDADDSTIKRAYRKLSLKYHPGASVAGPAKPRPPAPRRPFGTPARSHPAATRPTHLPHRRQESGGRGGPSPLYGGGACV